jgi:hypothetical protein
MFGEILFCFKCSHAAHAGCGDRLAIDIVGDVTGGINAFDRVVAVESGAVTR